MSVLTIADSITYHLEISMKIIDPHLHLFDLNQGDYHWLKAQNPPYWPDKAQIAKNFTEQDLMLTAPLTLAGFVHIEAGFDNQQPWREIAWLEQTCQGNFRCIAMLDITLTPGEFKRQLALLLHYQRVVGIRYILDDQALAILRHENTFTNLQTLAEHSLSFECQLSLLDSAAVRQLRHIFSQLPRLSCCINHAGLPAELDQSQLKQIINANDRRHVWLQSLASLSALPHIYIKCSGYEMLAREFTDDVPEKIITQCLQFFGINRVMLASNFPLSLWSHSYQKTWQINRSLAFSEHDLSKLCYENAYRYYQFNAAN